MVKILGGPVDRDPREVLCALCCLSESTLFTITCQEVNADGSVPRLDSLPENIDLYRQVFTRLSACGASDCRCWRPVTSRGAQLLCSKIFLLNLVLILVVVKLKVQLCSYSIDGNEPMRGFLEKKIQPNS